MCGEQKIAMQCYHTIAWSFYNVYNNSKKYNPKTKEEWSATEKREATKWASYEHATAGVEVSC